MPLRRLRSALPLLLATAGLAIALIRCGSGISDRPVALAPLPISLWAVGQDGKIRSSDDGGDSWDAYSTRATTIDFYGVASEDDTTYVSFGLSLTAQGSRTVNTGARGRTGSRRDSHP